MSLLRLQLTARYRSQAPVLRDVRLEIAAGESVGLIGSSGSGKSTLSLAILGLLDWKGAKVEGSVEFDGRDLLRLPERELRKIRGKEIALVMQSAASALNPALRIVTQFREAWSVHSSKPWPQGARKMASLFERVGLPSDEAFARRLPGEVSLGQAQRVLIALSLLHDPKLLLADEPTSALDVVRQRELLELLSDLALERSMATLFISHDLLSVAAFCRRVAILDQGEIVEQGPVEEIFASPRHPYSQKLVAALHGIPEWNPQGADAAGVIQTRSFPNPLLALDTAVSSVSACPPESRTPRNSETTSYSRE